MKAILHISVMAVLLVSGCATRTVRQQIVEVRPDTPGLKTAVAEKRPEQEKIRPAAYNHYVNGLIYEQIGNHSAAAESFKRALQYHPNCYQLRFALAGSFSRLREFDHVLAVLEVISPEDADVYSLRAASYAALGKEDSARMAFLELARLKPGNATAFAFLAGFYRRQQDIDSVIWAYESLTRIRPDNERNWQELGRLQMRKGDFEQAKESFSKSVAIRRDPTNILSLVGLAELYMLDEQVDSALSTYEAAVAIDPNNVVINRELSIIYATLDSLARAVPYAAKVAELTPFDATAARRLGVLYFGLDSLRLADSILTGLVTSGDRNFANHYYLGRIAVLTEDHPRAVDEFTVLTGLADSLPGSWLDLGYAYRLSSQPEKEILTYETGLTHMRDEQGTLRLLFALGAACEQSGKIEKAVTIFEEIIARSPDHAQALNYLGYMLADRGQRLFYAKGLIERAVELVPDNAAYLDSYGCVFFRLGNYAEALVHLKRAVSLDNDPTILDHLGDAYMATGDSENARIWWQEALELTPDNEQIRKKLGY